MKYLILVLFLVGCVEDNSPIKIKYRNELSAKCSADCAPLKGVWEKNRQLKSDCQCIMENEK